VNQTQQMEPGCRMKPRNSVPRLADQRSPALLVARPEQSVLDALAELGDVEAEASEIAMGWALLKQAALRSSQQERAWRTGTTRILVHDRVSDGETCCRFAT